MAKERETLKGIKESGIGLTIKRNSFWGEDKLDDLPQNISLQQQYENAYNNFPLVQQCINKTKEDVSQERIVEEFFKVLSKKKISINLHYFQLLNKYFPQMPHLVLPNPGWLNLLQPTIRRPWNIARLH